MMGVGWLRSYVLLSGLFGLSAFALVWNVEVTKNPMCDDKCQEKFPNLAYVVFRSKLCSIHYFTAASNVLGPPSIFLVKSSKPDAKLNINWMTLLGNHKYEAIRVENSTEIYGLTYFSIIDFRDPDGHADLWTDSKNNKTFQEYYLTQFEYSFDRIDLSPNGKTGLVEIVYRSDPRRRHRLVFDGGHIEIKVVFSTKDIAARGLRAGLTFESEISFHKLTILHPDSKLGVGILLFSNLSLSPTGDFLETTRSVSASSPSGTTAPKRVSYVHLEQEGTPSVFQRGGFSMSAQTLVQPSLNRTPVLFLPSPLAHSKSGGKGSTGDFLETTRSVSASSPSGTTAPKRVSYVHLEQEGTPSVFQRGGFSMSAQTLVQPSLNRTPVLFLPSPLAHSKSGGKGSTRVLVLAGPRITLKSTQRRRLRHSLAKALYGVTYEQSHQTTRNASRKRNPIGTRFQRFAISAPGQQTAEHVAWSMTLTMDVEEKVDHMAVTQSNESAQGIYYWGLFLLNWLSSFNMN